MKFPNAYAGVKKIFSAEILQLISILLAVPAVIAIIVMAAAASIEETGVAVGSLIISAAAGVGAAVLSVIAFIFTLIGLKKGSMDEPIFKSALSLTLLGIIAAVIYGAVTPFQTDGNVALKLIADFSKIFSDVAHILVVYYIIEAIRSLAVKLGNKKVEKKASTVVYIIIAVYCLALIASVIGTFAVNDATSAISGILALVAVGLSVVEYVIYLTFLANAKTMLKE